MALCDKGEMRTVNRSVDPAELNDSSRSTENGSFLQSGSSSEIGPTVAASGDSIERAKEILGHTAADPYATPVKELSPKVGLGDVGMNGSGGKAAKSSSDKKKRGLSWYSVSKHTLAFFLLSFIYSGLMFLLWSCLSFPINGSTDLIKSVYLSD